MHYLAVGIALGVCAWAAGALAFPIYMRAYGKREENGCTNIEIVDIEHYVSTIAVMAFAAGVVFQMTIGEIGK